MSPETDALVILLAIPLSKRSFSKNDKEKYQEVIVESQSSIKAELENFLHNKNYILGMQAHKLLINNLNQ